ncbi:uncharacterized protein LOC129567385 [Sitodiplosis mosellana]|uniref:uncharacterized protein LOC129567385 n=1 Tax=Sitodiplosis mosellana TaxID=263140 RepID=UPI002443F9A5|nr:uncharacterized protein LOC129567385 [Sitodiplosis mosellana]
MPFISNGSEWKLIDDEEPYDKKRFVVVKTLHVKLNTTDTALPIQEFSIDQIRQHTRKFGQIESIEMLQDNSALVSFASDHMAHSMQLQHDFDKKTGIKQPFQVRPADTFEQPQSKTNLPPKKVFKVDEQTSKMCMLNEDCLLHLFKFLDLNSLVNMADVCKMFNGLLHKYSFPHIKKYEFKHDIFDTRKFNPTLLPKLLERMRRTLHCVGRHITDLTIEVGNRTSEWISAHDSAGGFWGILAEYVGTNLRQAYWQIGESHLSLLEREEEIAKIAPILRHLEHLRI